MNKRLSERGTFIRINPGLCDDGKKNNIVCHEKSWQIKDLFASDLKLSKQKLADLKAGIKEVVLTVIRLSLCGL